MRCETQSLWKTISRRLLAADDTAVHLVRDVRDNGDTRSCDGDGDGASPGASPTMLPVLGAWLRPWADDLAESEAPAREEEGEKAP